jgi:signal transduction histidine kinase
MTHQPFLAVPIKVQVSADGHLLSADPPAWRLHVLAGGEADGPIAIPGLASLATLARKIGMRVERPMRAADEDNDVELWVEAVPGTDLVDLSIIGWRDMVPSYGSFHQYEIVDQNSDEDTIHIDPELRLINMPAGFPEGSVGRHLGAIFILPGDADGRIPIVDALMERRAVEGDIIGVVGDDARYSLYLKPQFGADNDYVGHYGRLLKVAVAERTEEEMAAAGLSMGRQLASVLKQPLSRIVANAETIGSRMHGPLRENYAEYANDIANAARHLAELVDDMEDLEAIDRPDFSVAHDRIELGDIARRVSGLLALKASDHAIRLIVPEEGETVKAIGEFRRVLQILLNLVGNAIRYAPHGSTVTVSIMTVDEQAVLTVADEGLGVPEADRERVFEKFERLGRSGDGGSGLGLYISRRLSRAMGGDLIVTAAPSGGALFKLTLPSR